mmetsp:Transcript_21463/g.51206  ORF Transcript_21463/g.51206 Transcript_21463/m.51206 type:complete len:594 (-) Transcript_21463:313-2094(-)
MHKRFNLQGSSTHARTSSSVEDPRPERHPTAGSIHSLRNEQGCRPPIQSGRYRGLAATPEAFQISRQHMGEAHHRQICLHEQRPDPPLQLQMVGPRVRRYRLPPDAPRGMEEGEQLVQPPLDLTAKPYTKAQKIRSSSNSNSPNLETEALVSRARESSRGMHTVPSLPKPVLSREARQARGSRAARLERWGLQGTLPSWSYFWRKGSLNMRKTLPGLPVWFEDSQQQEEKQTATRYNLLRISPALPWADSMKETFRSALGHDSLGRTATELCMASLAPSSMKSYTSCFKKFLQFCSEEDILPQQVTTNHIVRYIAWIAREGRIAADSLQPYLSAVNKFLKDHLQEPVATGPMIAAARRGFRQLQEDLIPSAHRVAIPASFALACLDHAEREKNATLLPRLLSLRNCLVVATNFLFPVRGSTMAGLLKDDFVIDDSSFTFFCRTCKGFTGNNLKNKPLLQIPISANTRLAVLLRVWKEKQALIFGKKQFSHFWQLPHEIPEKWSADTVSRWLQQAAAQLNYAAPTGEKWSSHSLRKGGASAANAAGVNLALIRYLGAWAKTSHVVLDYIDPLMLPDEASRAFFGWLSSSNFYPV